VITAVIIGVLLGLVNGITEAIPFWVLFLVAAASLVLLLLGRTLLRRGSDAA
jgi:hypothetical protein